MKRFLASVIVVVAFTFYAIFSRGNSTTIAVGGVTAGSSASTPSTATTLPVTTGGEDDDDDYVAAQQTADTTVAPAPSSGGFADGTYTGSQASALYGMVQVQVTIQGGRIANVQFLSHPTGNRSDQINARAVPILTQEAISAQGANVQVVSGATLTSNAFMESLQSALSQA